LNADADRRVLRRLLRRRGSRFRQGPAAQAAAPTRPQAWLDVRIRPTDDLPFTPSAFIFDVEGTLVDNVLPNLQCWSETLAELGFHFGVADLHPFSGMDAKQMLRQLIKKHDPKLLEHIVKLQGERYREHYLPHIRASAGVRQLFAAIKRAGAKIALATSCDRGDLTHYRGLMNVDDLLDNVCCGDDVRREKPRPDVVSLAARKLRLLPSQMVMVGDTPYDAEAACAAGLAAIGVQSGHYSRSDLMDAGCASVFFDLQALRHKLNERAAPKDAAGAALKSHIAEAADSR
jgi:HAD superfamily hydrolase (TIGR01509 family)